jgi:hypothetical protein
LDRDSDFEPIDWYSEPSRPQPPFDHLPSTTGTVIEYEDDASQGDAFEGGGLDGGGLDGSGLDGSGLDDLPESPVLSTPGSKSRMDDGIIPNGSIETRLDEPEQPAPMTPSARFTNEEHGAASGVDDAGASQEWGAGDWVSDDGHEFGGDASATEISARRDRRPLGDALTDPVIDIQVGEEATDITEADLIAQSLESAPLTTDRPAPDIRRFQQTLIRPDTCVTADEDEETTLDTVQGSNSSQSGLNRPKIKLTPLIMSRSAPEYTILLDDVEMRYTVPPPPGHAAAEPTIGVQPSKSEPQETLDAKEVISSTPDTILPIVLGGSALELSKLSDPAAIVDAHKEENMSIVDRFISEARPQETPLEPTPTADVEYLADMEDAIAEVDELVDDDEYEYVEVDEEGNEVATASGDIEDGVDYEYEYVDEDEDEDEDEDGEDDGDVEYEYVEVDVDEDGNEIEATLVEDGKEVDDDEYEYEYVDDDDDGDDGEAVAIATGDVADDVEYEYEYVDDDEDEEEPDDGVVSAEADDDDEYEYEDEYDDDEVEDEV